MTNLKKFQNQQPTKKPNQTTKKKKTPTKESLVKGNISKLSLKPA